MIFLSTQLIKLLQKCLRSFHVLFLMHKIMLLTMVIFFFACCCSKLFKNSMKNSLSTSNKNKSQLFQFLLRLTLFEFRYSDKINHNIYELFRLFWALLTQNGGNFWFVFSNSILFEIFLNDYKFTLADNYHNNSLVVK